MAKLEIGKRCPYGHMMAGANVLRYSVSSPANGTREYLKCRACWSAPRAAKARAYYETVVKPARALKDQLVRMTSGR